VKAGISHPLILNCSIYFRTRKALFQGIERAGYFCAVRGYFMPDFF